MRYRSAAFCLLFILAACSGGKPEKREVPSVFDDFYVDYLRLHTIDATALGAHAFDNVLNVEISDDWRADTRVTYTEYLDRLALLDPDALSDQDRLSRDVLEWYLRIELRLLDHDTHLMPVNQFDSMPLTFAQLASGTSIHPFESEVDYENFLGRMSGFESWVDTAIANMREGMKRGQVQPAVIIERVIPQLRELTSGPLEESVFYGPVRRFDAAYTGDRASRLRSRYVDALRMRVLPSYDRLLHFLEDEYLPACRSSAGLGGIPGGAALYADLVRYWTTTDRDADDIHALGLSEVARIRSEMDRIRQENGFDGSLEAYFRSIVSDPRMRPFTSPVQILDAFTSMEEGMESRLGNLFGVRPETPFEVRQVESWRAASSSAHYIQGSPDGSRPGIFYVPILDARAFNVMGMESLFAHEAIPGHHYQISIQQESGSIPDFRKAVFFSAFGEGWALYAESLGAELGLYRESWSEMARLNSELLRAVRLVVDTGLHSRGWSREQAISYMTRNLPAMSDAGAANQVERYMVLPGQALSYKMGELTIRNLRTESAAALGDEFDIRSFHDQVLENGAIPLSVLQRRIRSGLND